MFCAQHGSLRLLTTSPLFFHRYSATFDDSCSDDGDDGGDFYGDILLEALAANAGSIVGGSSDIEKEASYEEEEGEAEDDEQEGKGDGEGINGDGAGQSDGASDSSSEVHL